MFKNLQIGYVPYNPDLSHPDDRRRFPFFAARNNVDFEIADIKKCYDIVVLPAPANLSQWLLYKKRNPNTKFVFEMVDSLIYQSDISNILFKGVGRFLIGKESFPYLDHKSLLIKWLKIADVVICSSQKIKVEIEKWNPNVMVSLDYLEHEYKFLKTDYSIKGKMKLFWEGQGVILPHFLHFKEVLKKISSFCELHVVTSEAYPLFGPFVKKNVEVVLQKLPIDTHFHKWDINRNCTLFSKFDCGVIPLNKKNIYSWHKPANKLISFWLSGLPTLTSNTPAYTDLANKAEGNLLCSTNDDWISKIHEIREMKAEEREHLARKNFNFARTFYSNEAHDAFWINLFENLHVTRQRNVEIILPNFSLNEGSLRRPGSLGWIDRLTKNIVH
jgi:hypothetical protein